MSIEPTRPEGQGDEALLAEIRDRYTAWSDRWRTTREERKTDLR